MQFFVSLNWADDNFGHSFSKIMMILKNGPLTDISSINIIINNRKNDDEKSSS